MPSSVCQGLNPAQVSAVSHGSGPLLIIAGAGTGKTAVIIRRIAYLIENKLAKPAEIIALTFTDKAAEEMELRVDQLVPYGYVDVNISTFHAFGDQILREHAIDLGMRPDYRVLTLAEQLVFLREHLFELPLNYYKSLGDPTKHLEALLGIISRAQDEGIFPKEYLAWATKNKKHEEYAQHFEIARVYKKYQELKAAKGFVDFADQVGLVLQLLQKRPAILKKLAERYKYILVDEFQDTNYAQLQLLLLLAGKKANLTVVGDDDQAIYKFRGAAISNILNFEKHFKKCKKVVLTQNYRSGQLILDSARKLIVHNNPDRLEVRSKIIKKLVSAAKVPLNLPEHYHFDRVASEADWVAEIIKKKMDLGYKFADFAILVRANADSQPFIQALNMQSIPYQFSGGSGLYVSQAVKMAIAFLRVIGDFTDSISLFDFSISTLYGLNPVDLQKINTYAHRRNQTLHHVFTHLGESGDLSSEFGVLEDIREDSRKIVAQIMDDIRYYLDYAKERKTGEVLYHFLKKSGLLVKLAKGNEKEMQNIARFFEKVRQFGDVAEKDRVLEFVKYLNLLKDAGDNPETAAVDEEVDAVKILTVHKAKGLEFRVVFMVSLVAEKFPVRFRSSSLELPEELIKEKLTSGDFHLQEERRLFYVAMTRAKEELYFTSSADYGGKRLRKVSPFVLEALEKPRVDLKIIKKSPKDQIELFAPQEINYPATVKFNKEGPLYLSFNQIDDYLTCPLKYKYVHLLHVPLLPNQQILVGSALHKAAQAFAMAKLRKQMFTERDLIKVLLDSWSSEGFISRQHEEQRLLSAQKSLKAFFKAEKLNKRKIRCVEEAFSVPLGDVVLRGRWDRVDEDKGQIFIVDYKSSEIREQVVADKRAKESLQLSIYALVWKEKYGQLPDGEELYFLESGLVGKIRKDEGDLLKAREIIQKTVEGIRKDQFKATPNSFKCSYCAYSEICPAAV
ncbi:MAG: ATP-dependent DNA helicase [Candidatus Margulisiibacteriota bacterium]